MMVKRENQESRHYTRKCLGLPPACLKNKQQAMPPAIALLRTEFNRQMT